MKTENALASDRSANSSMRLSGKLRMIQAGIEATEFIVVEGCPWTLVACRRTHWMMQRRIRRLTHLVFHSTTVAALVCLGCWVGRLLLVLRVAVLWEIGLVMLNNQGNFVLSVIVSGLVSPLIAVTVASHFTQPRNV
jgi:hypothetical protein